MATLGPPDSLVRIITVKRLRDYARLHPTTASTLDHWEELISCGRFVNLVELRRVLPSADQVEADSGRTVTVFNIKNHCRLITAIHYNHQIIYILRLLTHNEYDQAHWKSHL
jgi:mRNA interferase HigB